MIRQYIVSSNIHAVGHHRGNLYIKFNSGAAYEYTKVPLRAYLDLAGSESAGQHFHRNINGKFDYVKLDFDPFANATKEAA